MSRKFKKSEYYSKYSDQYFLLPFRFININNSQELLVNEIGDFIVSKKGTSKKIADRAIHLTEI